MPSLVHRLAAKRAGVSGKAGNALIRVRVDKIDFELTPRFSVMLPFLERVRLMSLLCQVFASWPGNQQRRFLRQA